MNNIIKIILFDVLSSKVNQFSVEIRFDKLIQPPRANKLIGFLFVVESGYWLNI